MLTTTDRFNLVRNLVQMIEETLFTKECELEFANLQKLSDPNWELYAIGDKRLGMQGLTGEIKTLKTKLKFYQAKLEEMEKAQ